MSGESRLQIGSRWAANKSHYQLKSISLPKWCFLPCFLLSGACMTKSMVITSSRRATWEQRDTVAESCGPSGVLFKWLAKGGVSSWVWLPGLLQGMWMLTSLALSLQLSEVARVNSWCTFSQDYPLALSRQAAGTHQEQRIEQKVLKDDAIFPLWRPLGL